MASEPSVARLDPSLERRFGMASGVLSLAVVALGASVLIGWGLGSPTLKSIRPSLETMKANAALLFVLMGVSVWLSRRQPASPATKGMALGVIVVSAATLAEYVFHLDLGIDELLVVDPAPIATGDPGRMAPAAATTFVLLGAAGLAAGVPRLDRLRQTALLAAAASALVATGGYVLGVSALYAIGPYSAVALHTAIGLLALCVAAALTTPTVGFPALLGAPTEAGRFTRRFLPIVVVVPLALGRVGIQGERSGLFDASVGVVLLVVGCIGTLGATVWLVGTRLHREEVERTRAIDQLLVALDAAPAGMMMVDEHRTIALVNRRVEEVFGYDRRDLVGRSLDVLVPAHARPRHGDLVKAYFDAPTPRQMGGGREFPGLRRDGSEVPLEIGLTPIEMDAGRMTLASVVDVTGRRQDQAERERLTAELQALTRDLEGRVEARTRALRTSAQRQEVLLKEVHHRVKNNLAVISSLFYLQQHSAGDERSARIFEETARRVRSMALVHETLYGSQDLAAVDFGEYARVLARELWDTYSPGDGVELLTALEPVSIGIDRAVPCGLILNELVTNALRHAFPGGRTGAVFVDVRRSGDARVTIGVSDDGVGLPPDLDAEQSASLGLRLVRSLARQLDATFQLARRERGTEARLSFQVEAHATDGA